MPLALSTLPLSTAAIASGVSGGHGEGGFVPDLAWVAPFLGILLAIAILPQVARDWFHDHKNQLLVALLCGLPALGLFLSHDPAQVWHTLHEYGSFVILLGSLFTISAGIVLRGDLRATPLTNTGILAVGALLASFMGTTGAAMLLIRPLLRTNSERLYRTHTVVFFIFLVCNAGGMLTPLGDPPLFMGYLKGVPFSWTFTLFMPWLFVCGSLLLIYLIVDSRFYAREPEAAIARDRLEVQPIRLAGRLNFLWLLGVILAVAFLTPRNLYNWLPGIPHVGLLREVALLLLAFLAYRTTPSEYRQVNRFEWYPIIEVAILFLGIFLSMMPAIRLLEVRGAELGLTSPLQFFWATGILSSILDNAPTYLVFFEAGRAVTGSGAATGSTLLLPGGAISIQILTGISLGAVLMGANSYIGNAPNFMIRSIAERQKVRMPSFLAYMFYAAVILLPLYAGVCCLFLL